MANLDCGHPEGCWDTMFDCCRWCHQTATLQTKLDEVKAERKAIYEQVAKTAIVLTPGEHDLTLKEPIGMLVMFGGSINFRGGSDVAKAKEAVRAEGESGADSDTRPEAPDTV